MKKKIVIIFSLILIFLVSGIIFFKTYHMNNNDNEINNEINQNTTSIISDEQQKDENISNMDKNNNNMVSEENTILSEEVSSYWQNYQNPEHWSEKTNNYTLSYILDPDKNTENELEKKSNTIIKNELPTDEKGIFIPKDSRQQLEDFLKKNVNNNFYIDTQGFLKYSENTNSLELSNDLTILIKELISNTKKMTILSISYSYYAENNVIDNAPTDIPIELNYLLFKPKQNIDLLIYSQYNFSLESFIQGIEKLTGKNIETK